MTIAILKAEVIDYGYVVFEANAMIFDIETT